MLTHPRHTTYVGLLLILGLLGGGCVSEADEASPSTETAATSSGPKALNKLSPSEQAGDWKLLFNGEDLSAWRGFEQKRIPQGWSVENGAIAFSGDGTGDLMTRRTFRDFELKVDWKISSGGNSGIFYRVSEAAPSVPASGPEYQLIDAEHYEGTLDEVQRTGANYALHPPTQDVVKPVGAWNETRILVRGDHVEHWLNGSKVVAYEIGSADWQQRVEASKFSDDPGYAQSEEGHIVLQNHGDPVWFRDLKIRPL